MVLICRAGTDATCTGLEELETSRDERVHREDEHPLPCVRAGTWASTLMHICVCERLRKGYVPVPERWSCS